MRWFWIDRFTEFVAGKRATAVKCVSLAEPHVVDYTPGFPQLSNSFVVEGVAQTGGLLVSQTTDFLGRVVLAKIGKAVFHAPALPGEILTYRVELLSLQPDGAVIQATCHADGKLQAELELMFACLDERFGKAPLFEPAGFLRLLRSLQLFHLGRYEDGRQVQVPEHLLEAERAAGCNA